MRKTVLTWMTLPLSLPLSSAPLAAHRPILVQVARQILGPRGLGSDVEDVVQEALSRASTLSGYDGARPMLPWLIGVTRNVALDTLRKQRRLAARQSELTEDMPSAIPTPEQALAERERLNRLAVKLDALPVEMRQALLMSQAEGQSYQEISTALGVPVGTVATWISRARRSVIETGEGTQ